MTNVMFLMKKSGFFEKFYPELSRGITIEKTICQPYDLLMGANIRYDAFGQPYKGNLSGGMNLGYTGKPYDTTTGLYNYGYRDYKPQAARFTTVDPIRDGNNWFAYVNNDPVNMIDLLGLDMMYSTYIDHVITPTCLTLLRFVFELGQEALIGLHITQLKIWQKRGSF